VFGLLQTSFLIKIPFFFAVAVFGNLISREARTLKLQQDSSSRLTEGLRKRLEETTKSKDKLDSHLRLMQNFNEGIVNSIESGVMVMDLSGIITAFNPAAEKITGVRRDEAFLKKSDTNNTLQTICSFMEQGREKPVRRQEVTLKTASGEDKIIGISVYLLKYRKEMVVGTVAVFTDLTETVELREKARESEKLSVQQEMIASFVHGLTKPLNSIQRLSQLILSEGENKVNRDKYATAISKGIVGIIRSIKEIPTPLEGGITHPKDTTTPPKGTLPERDLLDANALVGEVVDSMKAHAEENHSSVTWKPGEGLPRISGNRGQLKNMFFDLVQDSIRASEADGEIRVSTSRTGSGVSVEIEGNGPGITKKTQIMSSKLLPTKAKGTGLGLAIAKKIVEDHGGTIHVHNAPGRGSKLTVNLPAGQPTSSSKEDALLLSLEKQTVLIADP